jgi:putative ABC transport system permease protein
MDPSSIENRPLAPEGFTFPAGTTFVRIRSARVDEGYFQTLNIAIHRGRAFRSSDDATAPRVAIVNETFAARYWPGGDALAKRIRLTESGGAVAEIVGIAANHKYRGLSEGAVEFVYFPWAQEPSNDTTLLVQTSGEPEATAAPLRQAVLSVDQRMPVLAMRTMDDFFQASTVIFSTVIVRIVAGMGSMGLALALIGLYGLVAYSVSRRTREIGIRVAVGANPGSVLRMVLHHGLLLSLCGTGAGVLGSVAVRGALRAVFPFDDVANLESTTHLLVVPALFAITLLAAYIPARRAARLDPLMALRHE